MPDVYRICYSGSMSEQRIQTARFGELTIESDNILHFVEPILGFPNSQDFMLLDHAENSPFKWLQSIQEPELAFVVTNPQFFGIPYEFAIGDEYVTKLALSNADETLVLTIVNIPAGNPTQMTSNLLGPLVINQPKRLGMQLVLADNQYSTKTPLLQPAATASNAEGNPKSKNAPVAS